MGLKMDSRGVKGGEGGEVTSLCFGVLCVSRAENPRRALFSECDRVNIMNDRFEKSSLLINGVSLFSLRFVSVKTKRKCKGQICYSQNPQQSIKYNILVLLKNYKKNLSISNSTSDTALYLHRISCHVW